MSADTYRPGMSLADFRAFIEQRDATPPAAAECPHPYDDVVQTVSTTRVVDDPRLPSRVVVVIVADCDRCGAMLDQQHMRAT